MPKNPTRYQEKWEKYIDPNGILYKIWCKKHGDKSAWCKVCEKTIDVEVMGKSAIKQHAQRKKHQKLMALKNIEQNEQNEQIEQGLQQEEEEEQEEDDDNIDTKIRKAEILWSLLCAEHDLSFLVNDHTTRIFSEMFTDSVIAAGYKCSRTKVRYNITHGTYQTFKSQLDKKLRENVFSLQIDESNKMYGRKFLIMLVKFYDKEEGKIVNRFWELKETNKGDAASLVKAIRDTFEEHDVPYKNLIQIMSDSPSVMRGPYTGVITQMKENAPHLIDLGGCSLHHVSNAVKNATEKLYKAEDIEEFLQDVSTFFSFHVEFAEEFSHLQEELQIPMHRLIKYIDIRFLSIYSSVTRVIEQYEAIKSLFLVKIPRYHPKVAKQARVIRIIQKLRDKITLPTLEFLSFILDSFNKYEQLFQRSESTIHLLYNKQVDLYRTTLLAFCDFDKIARITSDSELVKFDYKKAENQLNKSKINVGVKATKLIKSISDDEKAVYTCGVKEFLMKVADGLHKNLSLQNHTLADLRFLAPINRTVSHERAIIRVAKKLPPCSHLTTSEIDKLALEWKYLVLEKFSWDRLDSLITHWGKIFQFKDESGELKFPTINKVVRCCLALSEANAQAERTFSQIAHLIRKDRNRLLPETVRALMVTKSFIENTGPCYKQQISRELLNDVKNAASLYLNRNEDDVDENNNVIGPSQSELVEETVCTEIRYQEEKIRLNNESAKKLIEEAQKIMTENEKLTSELGKLKKKENKEIENLKRKQQKCQTDHKSKKTRK